MSGHEGEVRSVAISTDCQWTASGSADKTVRIWDASTGENAGPPLRGHDGEVKAIAFSYDGVRLASGSVDKTICIWQIQSGNKLMSMMCASAVIFVAYSPDGRVIAAGSSSGTIQTFQVASGKRGLFVNYHDPKGIVALAFSPHGATIPAARDNDIVGIDLDRQIKVLTAIGHTARVNFIACSPDGRFIASGADDATVRLWDAKSGQPHGKVLSGHSGAVRSLAFSSDHQSVFSAGSDGTIRVWELENTKSANQHARDFLVALKLVRFQDGWLLSPAPSEERLLWVPPEHRQHLEISGDSRVIASHWKHATLNIDVASLYLGEHWSKCWRGNRPLVY